MDLAQPEGMDDLADLWNLLAVDHDAPGAVLHRPRDPFERGLQLARGDGLAGEPRVEVGVLGVSGTEEPVGEQEQVLLEADRRFGPGAGEARLERDQVMPLGHLGARGPGLGPDDAVQLEQCLGQLTGQAVAGRLELVADLNAFLGGAGRRVVVEPITLQQVVDLQQATEVAGLPLGQEVGQPDDRRRRPPGPLHPLHPLHVVHR